MVKSVGTDPSDLLLYRDWKRFTRETEERFPEDIFYLYILNFDEYQVVVRSITV